LSANDASSSRNLINCHLLSNLLATDLQKREINQFAETKEVGKLGAMITCRRGVKMKRSVDAEYGVVGLTGMSRLLNILTVGDAGFEAGGFRNAPFPKSIFPKTVDSGFHGKP
jgi:hypothetical protein